MKQELINVYVALKNKTGKVDITHCYCPAGKSGYYNHIMALLIQLAEYSMSGIERIPDVIACTSSARQWSIPGNKEVRKGPVMTTAVRKEVSKLGINCTLYDPRLNSNADAFHKKVGIFQQTLFDEDPKIGLAHCIPNERYAYSKLSMVIFSHVHLCHINCSLLITTLNLLPISFYSKIDTFHDAMIQTLPIKFI